MKKEKIKALKKLSEMLPKAITLVTESHVALGHQLPEQVLATATIPIEAEKSYVYKNKKVVEVNHLNRLKKAFARNKEKGLIDYIEWVDRNNQRMNELFKEMKLTEVSDELKQVAKRGEKGFWSNLISFLFSFYSIFLSKSKQLKAA